MTIERNQLVQAFFDQTHVYLKNQYGIRLRQQIVHELLGSVAGANILDVGCGNGTVSAPFLQSPNNHLTLLDLSDNMLAEARNHIPSLWQERVTYHHGDIIGFESASPFDVILCLGVLAHVPSVDATLHKIVALLKPNGYCLVQFTDYDKWVARLGSMYFGLREYFMPGYHYFPNRLCFSEMKYKLTQVGLMVKDQRRYSLLLPGMGKLPNSFLFRYQMATLRNPLLSARGSEVILLLKKQG